MISLFETFDASPGHTLSFPCTPCGSKNRWRELKGAAAARNASDFIALARVSP